MTLIRNWYNHDATCPLLKIHSWTTLMLKRYNHGVFHHSNIEHNVSYFCTQLARLQQLGYASNVIGDPLTIVVAQVEYLVL